mgnify:CR=1 FL=1
MIGRGYNYFRPVGVKNLFTPGRSGGESYSQGSSEVREWCKKEIQVTAKVRCTYCNNAGEEVDPLSEAESGRISSGGDSDLPEKGFSIKGTWKQKCFCEDVDVVTVPGSGGGMDTYIPEGCAKDKPGLGKCEKQKDEDGDTLPDEPEEREISLITTDCTYPCLEGWDDSTTIDEGYRYDALGKECILDKNGDIDVCVKRKDDPRFKVGATLNTASPEDGGNGLSSSEEQALKDCKVEKKQSRPLQALGWRRTTEYGPLTQEQVDCLHDKVCCPKEKEDQVDRHNSSKILNDLIISKLPHHHCYESPQSGEPPETP